MTHTLPESKSPWVLVVEDNPDLRRHLSYVLQDGGIACVLVPNENAALDKLLQPGATDEIVAIVADINLSEAGGDVRGGILLAERLTQKQVQILIVLISYDPWIYLPAKDSLEFRDLANRVRVHSVLDRNSDSFNQELIQCLRRVTRETEGER